MYEICGKIYVYIKLYLKICKNMKNKINILELKEYMTKKFLLLLF